MEVTWEDVLFSIENLLMETEIQDNNSDLGFHEAALVLNDDTNGWQAKHDSHWSRKEHFDLQSFALTSTFSKDLADHTEPMFTAKDVEEAVQRGIQRVIASFRNEGKSSST